MSVGQIWATNSLGGFLTAPILSDKVRLQAIPKMRFRQFTRLEGQFGPNLGDTLQWKKASNLATQGRIISETEIVPETQITIFSDSIVVQEFSNSVPYTDRVEQLARLSITDIIVQKLKDDMANTLDRAVNTQFALADSVYTPTGSYQNPTSTFATNGTPGATATRPNLLFDVKEIVDKLKSTFFTPFYDANDNYIAIASTVFLRGLKDDRETIELQKFGDPERLFRGECGRVYGCRFTEESNVLSNSLAGGSGEAYFFGDDPCIEIVAKPEQIQAKVAGDFGRDQALRWVFWGAFAKTWSFSQQSQVRILRVNSL